MIWVLAIIAVLEGVVSGHGPALAIATMFFTLGVYSEAKKV